jgi:hypothetical protein
MRPSLVALSVSLLLRAAPAAAQGFCAPPKDSHEAQMFAAYSVPLAYALAESPSPLRPGAVRLGLEVTYLPDIDEQLRTATVCRPGKGPENTDFLFAYPRPRAAVGLPAGFRFEVSWIPPVRLNGVKSNLVGISLDRGIPLGSRAGELLLRAHATFGLIRAPITCDDNDLADPSSECFQGTRSDDRYHPNIFGVEGVFAWSLGGGTVRPFIGGGANVLHPRFQVNFTNQFGSLDDTRVEVDLTRGALFAGATWTPSPGLGLSGSIYAAPGDAVTGRVVLSYAVRR